MRQLRKLSKAALVGLLTALISLPGARVALAQGDASTATFKPEEIEQLVAPIALYPDALLAQVLMASTYPLEVVEAARWQQKNPSLKDKALDDALKQQDWDPSVKSLASFPQVLTMMNDELAWTQKLGDAFLAQQSDVMDAVQQLRGKAQAEGNLKTTEQQVVTVEQAPEPSQPVIIKIEPANPQVIYVPTYNPTVIYGAWPYPAYPPYYYYPPGYVATTAILSFGVGLAVGSALWGGCHWGAGHGNVNVNVNRYNSFNQNVSNNVTRINATNNNWQHNGDHRRGVQYRDKATQNQFNRGDRPDAASRDAFRGRAEQGRQQIAREGAGNMSRDLGTSGGAGNRLSGTQRPNAPAQRPNAPAQRPNAPTQRPNAPTQRTDVAGKGGANRGGGSAAFDGVGNGGQVRRDSARGQASQKSASNTSARAGGNRASAGGNKNAGGGRSGGGGGGGGRR
jgi:hypothetical protein